MDCNIVGAILAGRDPQLRRSGKAGDWVRSLLGRNMAYSYASSLHT